MNQKNPPQVLRNEMRADSVPVDEHYSTEGYFYDNPILTRTGIFKYKLEDGSERQRTAQGRKMCLTRRACKL